MKSTRYLLDVNVALALFHPHHEHAKAASEWFDRQEDPGCVLFCRVVQMGLLRLLTKPSLMRDGVQTPKQFWTVWDAAMEDERLLFVNEPASLVSYWRNLSMALPNKASAETDVYLAAFAQAGNLTLVTFDKGFSRFVDLSLEILRA